MHGRWGSKVPQLREAFGAVVGLAFKFRDKAAHRLPKTGAVLTAKLAPENPKKRINLM
jgi:hypothetical protein